MRHSCALPRRNHSSNSSQMLTDKASTGKNHFNYPCLSKLFCFIMQKPILQIRIFAARNNNNISYNSTANSSLGQIVGKEVKQTRPFLLDNTPLVGGEDYEIPKNSDMYVLADRVNYFIGSLVSGADGTFPNGASYCGRSFPKLTDADARTGPFSASTATAVNDCVLQSKPKKSFPLPDIFSLPTLFFRGRSCPCP